MVLFIVLYKVALAFKSRLTQCNLHVLLIRTEQYFPVVLFNILYKVILTFESVDEILTSDLALKCKLLRFTFPRCCSLFSTRWFYVFGLCMDEVLSHDHSNESYCGAVDCAVQDGRKF